MAVLSDDLLQMPEGYILDLISVLTLVGGEVTHQTTDF
ncbi:MAG TPA: hypothetical protein EYN37_09090 [Dehalococcoidia bacterium]|nr:hypothetical protein [Dehalococcoidia bacterium]